VSLAVLAASYTFGTVQQDDGSWWTLELQSVFFQAIKKDREQSQTNHNEPLVAANKTVISTFGTTSVTLNLGFRTCQWPFTLAMIDQPIIGADFLSHYARN
jgi:hypothetical protein